MFERETGEVVDPSRILLRELHSWSLWSMSTDSAWGQGSTKDIQWV